MIIRGIEIKSKYIFLTILLIIGFVLIFIIYWVVNSFFISINNTNQTSGDFTYRFYNQSTNKETVKTTPNKSINELVSSAVYQISSSQNYQSFYKYISSNNFFQTTSVESVLKPENNRQFVGNNPSNCISYVINVLVSYDCGGLLANAQVHIPATKTTPTFTTSTEGQGPAGFEEGIFTTPEGTFALSRLPAIEDTPRHVINKLTNNFISTEIININELDSNTFYQSRPYKTGFLVYSLNYSQILYFPTVKSTPTLISSTTIPEANKPISLDINGNKILTSYLIQSGEKSTTQITIIEEGSIRQFSIDQEYSIVNFCGNQKICLQNQNTLDIYDISSSKATYLYSLYNVNKLLNNQFGLLFVDNLGVVNFNVDSRVGFYSYTFGDYKYNGITNTPLGYLLVLENSRNQKITLLLDQNQINTSNIDKKVSLLLKNSNISNLSITGNNIFITPNLGDLEFNKQTDVFDYNPETRSRVNNEVNQLIKESGIDTNIYNIVNTSQ